MKKIFINAGVVMMVLAIGLAGFIGWTLYPHDSPQSLPPSLVASSSVEGRALIEGAQARADFDALSRAYQGQRLISYCGVASSVIVLEALGKTTNQNDFFTEEASRVRSQFKVIFGGMSLPELGALLRTYGVKASVHHASASSIEAFRAVIKRNLSQSDDYLLVNYQREKLGQGKVGHISPLAAYNEDSDRVLILDTASHKYPPTWVPVDMLFSAMTTTDSSSGLMRGYVEVSI